MIALFVLNKTDSMSKISDRVYSGVCWWLSHWACMHVVLCACGKDMESSSSCMVRVDGIFELLFFASYLNFFSFPLTRSLARKPQLGKESQNSIHIKIMYRRIYDFKWRLLHSTIFCAHTYLCVVQTKEEANRTYICCSFCGVHCMVKSCATLFNITFEGHYRNEIKLNETCNALIQP